jgi:Ca2+-binding RTX toxin-like protein
MTINPFSPILNTAVENVITLAVAPISVSEDGINNLIYTFTRTGATTNALTVKYDLTGTADSTDYTGATPGTGKTITFAVGSSTAIVTIDPKSDTQEESDETVVLTLATGTGYTIGTAGAVTGTILTDDYPIKQWTRLLGTSDYDLATALTTGNDGAIYVSGHTRGNLDGQTNNGSGNGSYDAFITKYNPDGTKVWTKLLGTSGDELAGALTTGNDGAIYVSGSTSGNLDGQTHSGDYWDAFITKYNPDGTKVWTKLLGTSGQFEGANALTTGNDGAIYVSGITYGDLDGQTNNGSRDAFITKYNPDGTKVWTKLLGSTGDDFANALTTGNDGAIYVSGITYGNLDGQTNSGYVDAFITKYNPDGTKVWTKLLGTSGYDWATALTTGNDGAIYVSGSTSGNLDGQTNSGGSDAFITKYNPDGTKVWTKLWGTSGGDSGDSAYALTTGNDGAIYASGYTGGNLDGQTYSGGYDAFITKYNPDGTKVWTKLLGTSDYDRASALTTGNDGTIYASGYTYGNLDGQTNSGYTDAFITKYQDAPDVKITLAVAPASVTEDGTPNLVYTFTRTEATTNALTVNYKVGGTATLNTDYSQSGAASFTATTGSITFAAGSATAALTINPTVDTTIENNETVILTLASDVGYVVGTTTAVTGTITNDDFPSLSINDISVVEGKDPNAVLLVSLSSPSSQNITVNYTTTALTATANSDYTTSTGTLTIAPNSTLATISIPILNDNTNESNEFFIVTLSNPVNATLNPNTSLGEVMISDTWFSALSRTLPEGVENLTLMGTATNGTGNSGNNVLTGNSANNTLNGGGGNDTLNGSTGVDTLIGGLGNDIFSVDSTTDVITENANEGTDTIQSSVTFSLATFPNIENLTLTGSSAINGTGNTANNVLTGNGANNLLSGDTGNDILTGAAGKDTLTGGAGIDKFGYKTLTDSLLANYDLITDFNATTGNDLFLVTTARAGFTTGLTVNTLDAAGIGAKLTTTNFAANYAAQFTFTSGTTTRTFVAINDAIAGFNVSTDSIVEVTGLTGTLGIGNFVTA